MRYPNIEIQTEIILTVSVSSVTVQANFVIGCFSYRGLLIFSSSANCSEHLVLKKKQYNL